MEPIYKDCANSISDIWVTWHTSATYSHVETVRRSYAFDIFVDLRSNFADLRNNFVKLRRDQMQSRQVRVIMLATHSERYCSKMNKTKRDSQILQMSFPKRKTTHQSNTTSLQKIVATYLNIPHIKIYTSRERVSPQFRYNDLWKAWNAFNYLPA